MFHVEHFRSPTRFARLFAAEQSTPAREVFLRCTIPPSRLAECSTWNILCKAGVEIDRMHLVFNRMRDCAGCTEIRHCIEH
jgi:hypothetical protein